MKQRLKILSPGVDNLGDKSDRPPLHVRETPAAEPFMASNRAGLAVILGSSLGFWALGSAILWFGLWREALVGLAVVPFLLIRPLKRAARWDVSLHGDLSEGR